MSDTAPTLVDLSTDDSDLHSNSAALHDILAGADVGLALFSPDLSILACNDTYRQLCGYSANEARTGVAMPDLIRLTLQRQGADEAEIEKTIENAVTNLQNGRSFPFRYKSPSGDVVEVRRRRLPNGTAVETVREVRLPDSETTLDVQFELLAETARARMAQALDVMADGFSIFDRAGRLVAYNKKYVELNNFVGDIIRPGVAYEEMLRAAIQRGAFKLNDMDAEQFYSWRLRQHQNPGEAYEMQLTDGRWVLVHDRRADDGSIVGVRSDITERKLREFDVLRISRELHDKNLQFDTALNNMIQGLCMFDETQKLVVCNKRYLEMYGFSGEVVKPGISLRQIMEYSVSIGNYTPEEAERALSERPDPEKLSKRTTLKQNLKDGRVIAVMNEPMRDGGSIATYQDITDVERHVRRQQLYTEKLERSNRELQDFAYVASHDLQEPLRKIETFSTRLSAKYENLLPEDGIMYVDRMQDAAKRMRRLINDLLDYSRVTTTAKPFVRIDLSLIMDEAIGDLQMRVEETGATFDIGELPFIEADAPQMHQLFLNLFNNSLKFSKPDVPPIVTVRAERQTVLDRGGMPTEQVLLTVEDNGIGFENEFKDQIFTIFQRLHGRMEYEGTGIGLATCRKIVERHNGQIDANGEPDRGCVFTITLPLEQPNHDEEARE